MSYHKLHKCPTDASACYSCYFIENDCCRFDVGPGAEPGTGPQPVLMDPADATILPAMAPPRPASGAVRPCCGNPGGCDAACVHRGRYLEARDRDAAAAPPRPDKVFAEPPIIKESGSVAGSILRESAEIVGGARNTTHGDKERSFQVIADLWNAYLNGRKVQGPITPFDVAQFMVLLKVGRSIQGKPVRDHFVDAAGYSGIAGELSEGRANG